MNEKEIYHGTHSHFEETLLKVLLKLNDTMERQVFATQRVTNALLEMTHKMDLALWKIAEEVNELSHS